MRPGLVAEVKTHDLRAALRAALPHVPRGKEAPEWLQLVRVTPFVDGLEVSSTDRYTAALTQVPVWEYDGDGAEVFDLTVDQVRALLEVFPEPGKGDEFTVRVEVFPGLVRFVDTSGLFDGKELALPRDAVSDRFPEIRKLVRGRIRQNVRMDGDVWLDERRLARFTTAQRVYGYPLIFEPMKGGLIPQALVVRCGPSFVGVLAMTRPDEEAEREARAWADQWVERIGSGPAGVEIEVADYYGPRPSAPDEPGPDAG